MHSCSQLRLPSWLMYVLVTENADAFGCTALDSCRRQLTRRTQKSSGHHTITHHCFKRRTDQLMILVYGSWEEYIRIQTGVCSLLSIPYPISDDDDWSECTSHGLLGGVTGAVCYCFLQRFVALEHFLLGAEDVRVRGFVLPRVSQRWVTGPQDTHNTVPIRQILVVTCTANIMLCSWELTVNCRARYLSSATGTAIALFTRVCARREMKPVHSLRNSVVRMRGERGTTQSQSDHGSQCKV